MTPSKPIKTIPQSTPTATSTPKGTPILPSPITIPITPVTPVVTSPSAPSTTSSAVVLSTTPPVVNIPLTPAGYMPEPLTSFRGLHPKAGQIAAVPAVVTELTGSTTYASTFGPAVPEAESFVQVLDNAVGWTELRIAIETFLLYVKSQEGVTWKSALTQMDQVKAIYDVVVARTPAVAVQFPALARLLDVTNAIGQKSAASRKKAKATKAASTATAATASVGSPAAPAVNAVAVTPVAGQGGGAGH